MKFKLLLLSAFLLTVAAVWATPAEDDKAFTENKDNVVQCYEALNDFVNLREESDIIVQAPDMIPVIKLSEKTVAACDKIENDRDFRKRNPEAVEIKFISKVGWLKARAEKAKDMIDGLKVSISKGIKESVEFLADPDTNPQNASMLLGRINQGIATLEKLFPDSTELATAKKVDLPAAKANYDKAMRRVAGNKMPAGKADDGSLAAAYKARYGDDDVKRVVVTSDWVTRTELKDDNVSLKWETAQYIQAHVAVAKGNVCTVFPVTFQKTSDGKIKLYSSGISYPVLLANIKK